VFERDPYHGAFEAFKAFPADGHADRDREPKSDISAGSIGSLCKGVHDPLPAARGLEPAELGQGLGVGLDHVEDQRMASPARELELFSKYRELKRQRRGRAPRTPIEAELSEPHSLGEPSRLELGERVPACGLVPLGHPPGMESVDGEHLPPIPIRQLTLALPILGTHAPLDERDDPGGLRPSDHLVPDRVESRIGQVAMRVPARGPFATLHFHSISEGVTLTNKEIS
jgi:hypothetical protein